MCVLPFPLGQPVVSFLIDRKGKIARQDCKLRGREVNQITNDFSILWGLSAVFDQFVKQMGGELAKDGIKFIGIVVWAEAWIRQAYNDVTRLASSRT